MMKFFSDTDKKGSDYTKIPFTHPASLIATCLGAGRMRPFPGTWGSAVACLDFLLLWWLVCDVFGGSVFWVLAVIALFMPALYYIGQWAAEVFGRAVGVMDASATVIDEFVGQYIAFFAFFALYHALGYYPYGMVEVAIQVFFLFVLFRLFDIIKPWPINRAEKLPAGTGVMMDDVIAGLAAGLVWFAVVHWVSYS